MVELSLSVLASRKWGRWVNLVTIILVSLVGPSAWAESFELVRPFGDFALMEPALPPPTGGPFPYAATGSAPGWSIAQWNIPDGKLPTFSENDTTSGKAFQSSAAEAAIHVEKTPGGVILSLSQDGSVLPCLWPSTGRPRESDLLFAPQKPSRAPGYGAFSEKAADLPGLTGLSHLWLTMTVSMHGTESHQQNGCAVNKGSVIFALVLNNGPAHQTLFYQLALGFVCLPERTAQACGPNMDKAAFFSSKNPFGIDDKLPLFGTNWLGQDEPRTIHVDLLPRLLDLIRHGPAGMQNDNNSWRLDGLYAGQAIWGGTTIQTRWRDVSLVATTPG